MIIAGFDLDEDNRKMLRAAAGKREVRFINPTQDILRTVDSNRFTQWYPLPVLGRLFVAEHVGVSGARMVTLDSDMIVNGSLRQLAYRDLGDHYFAAIHDTPRFDDPGYFNSGLTLFDVDAYRRYDIARRCLTWLAEQEHHPGFPDQDALNFAVGHLWHRLARTWNYFNYENNGFTTEDYRLCRIAHFAGPKPWDHPDHPGLPVYQTYVQELRRRLVQAQHPDTASPRGLLARFRSGWHHLLPRKPRHRKN